MKKPRNRHGLLISRGAWRRFALVSASALGTLGAAGMGGCTGAPEAPKGSAATPPSASTVSALRTKAAPAGAPSFEAHIARTDERLGTPTFVVFTPNGDAPAASKAEDAARAALTSVARTARMSEGAKAAITLRSVHTAPAGGTIAEFGQQVDGIEVFRSGMSVALNSKLQPVTASGFLASATRAERRDFALTPAAAIAAAFKAATNMDLSAAQVTPAGDGQTDAAGYSRHDLPQVGAFHADTPARVRKVWYPRPGTLVAAYYVELDLRSTEQPDSELTAYVVDAHSSEVLFRHNMTVSDSYGYRVWADKDPPFLPQDSPEGTSFTPHPTGKADGKDPPYVAANLVTLQNAPFSKNDPWLPPGAMDLNGNNARAYGDILAPNGYSNGDILVTPTSPGVFDRPYDPASKPQGAPDGVRAITTNLFYVVNYMHDYFYDAGWNEASRNSQKSNYGRGGNENDATNLESQDYSGRNNANASTPADGSSPRIQMYLWDSNNGPHDLEVTAPAAVAGKIKYNGSTFGPKVYSFSGELVAAQDGGAKPFEACAALTNAAAVRGKVALVDRGTCGFQVKAANVQAAGAIGFVIANNAPGLPPVLGTTAGQPAITIPCVGISQEDGARIRPALAMGQVNIRGAQDPVDRDGSLDATIVTHEWGHTLSNRLIGNGSGLNTLQGAGMGEGWSDFVALLTVARAEDAALPINKDWKGVYAVGAHAVSAPGEDAHYYGIRRYPYSADLTKNPLTFKHIQDMNALPAMPAPRFGADGASNSEVHNSGEVWTSMLWQCYTNILRATDRYTFEQANQAMRNYLIAGMKLTPPGPTFLEARDGLLSAMLAVQPKDYVACFQGFAERGAGVGAKGPARDSRDNSTVVESFTVGTDIEFVSATLDDSTKSCDKDGVLDNGETGKLTIKIRNTGASPMTEGAVLVTSSVPTIVTIANGGMAKFPQIDPFQTGSVTIDVSMKDGKRDQPFTLTYKFTDPKLAVMRDITAKSDFVGHYDDRKESAASDDFSALTTVWSSAGDAALDQSVPWTRVTKEGKTSFLIKGNVAESDQYLVSPPLKVADTGSFGFTLQHLFQFETGMGQNADGGVIEISTDSGKTWADIGAAALTKNGYGGPIYVDNKPLKMRQAFVNQSVMYPMAMETTADLKQAFAGKTVLLRFRVGTDLGTGLYGWEIQKVSFTGLANTPFPSRAADAQSCANHPPVASAGDDQTVTPGSTVKLKGVGTDQDNDPLTFRWTQASGAMVTLGDITQAETSFLAPDVKEATTIQLTLVANDGKVDSAPSNITITIDPNAKPPIDPNQQGCSCDVGGSHKGSRSADLGGVMLLGLAGLWASRRRARG